MNSAPPHPDSPWSLDVEPWGAPVDGSLLLNEMEQLLRRFVVLPDYTAEALSLWILHTYAFHLRDITTYIGIESPEKRCGKTTLLTVLSELVNRPVVAANISSPAFFRVIEETRPTLLIDEADTFLQGNDELRGILNSGYTKKTAYVVRVASQPNSGGNSDSQRSTNGSQLVRFSSWCPKAMAAIGRLPETLADRSIVIRMHRKRGGDQCERLRNLDPGMLPGCCARFVLDNREAIVDAHPGIPRQLNDRAADIWEPLFALADLAGGEWPQKARRAAIHLTTSAHDSNPVGSLLLDIYIAFTENHVERMFSRDLTNWLNSCGNRPWSEPRRGKPIDELWLARRLRPYGVRPKSLWIDGLHAKGYLKGDLQEICGRYVTRADLNELNSEVPQENETPEPAAPVTAEACTPKQTSSESEGA